MKKKTLKLAHIPQVKIICWSIRVIAKKTPMQHPSKECYGWIDSPSFGANERSNDPHPMKEEVEKQEKKLENKVN